jgi:hypothetical protein
MAPTAKEKTTAPPLQPGETVSLADEERVVEVLTSSVLNLWDAVNNLTRLRPTKRPRYRVTIFGSARVPKDHWVYQAVRDLAAELTRLDCDIITGGGPGLMQAANEGARDANPADAEASVGVRIDLAHEQEVNAFVGRAYSHRTFFSRLHHFVVLSNAFVVVPGGIGTLLELSMVWQLLQVKKLYDTPLLLVGNMWKDLVCWADHHMADREPQMASAFDMRIPVCVPNVETAADIIRDARQRWLLSRSTEATP